MKFTLKEWARQLVLNVYEGWRLDPLTQEVCRYDLCVFYLLTLLWIHNFPIAANAVEETQAETFPTHGVFTQLACAPIYSCTSQTESTVTTEIIREVSGTLLCRWSYLRLCTDGWSRCCSGRRALTGPDQGRVGLVVTLGVEGFVWSCSLMFGGCRAVKQNKVKEKETRIDLNPNLVQ